MELWGVFLTGLTTGGLSCIAVQGGLLAGYLTNRKAEANGGELHWREAAVPTALFLAAKVATYTVVGVALGSLGSLFQLSLGMRITLQLLVGVFMVVSALRLFSNHPLLRKLELRPPAALRRVLRMSAKGESRLTPILLGVFTVLIPCGTTQAMEVLAVSSGTAARGALTLFVFTIATVPLFFLIGVLAHSGARAWQGALAKVTGVAVLIVGLYTFSGGLAIAGFPYTMQAVAQNYRSLYQGNLFQDSSNSTVASGIRDVTIKVTSAGYSPRTIDLTKGVPVRLHLVTNKTQGCSRSFVMQKYSIEKILPETGEEIVEFTPSEAGSIPFSCTMGMYTGKFTVS